MSSIGAAVAALGISEPEDRDLPIVIIAKDGGGAKHYALREVADQPIPPNTYLASGLFERGSISRYEGRSKGNLREILDLPFDADLVDWFQTDPDDPDDRKRVVDELKSTSVDEIWNYVEMQRADLEEAFAALDIPISRLDYTGYGLCAHLRVDPAIAGSIDDLQGLHAALVDAVNETVRYRLLDPQVKDAGTRITRLPGCVNDKGKEPIQSRTIAAYDATLDKAAAITLANRYARSRRQSPIPTRIIPDHGRALSQDSVAGIVEVLKRWWQEGHRHMLTLAIAGMMAGNGVPEAQTLQIIEAVSIDDLEPWDRKRAVADTYRRVASGLPTAGFSRLREMLPVDAVDYIDQQVSAIRGETVKLKPISTIVPIPPEATGPLPRLSDDIPAAQFDERWAQEWDNPPEAVYRGLVRDYVDIMLPTTEAPPAFHVASFLTLAGAMIGRKVKAVYASEAIYGNLYTVLVGPTGTSRKDTAIKRAIHLPQQVRHSNYELVWEFHIARDVSSAEGIVKMLDEHPNTMLYLTELTTLLANAQRQSTSTIRDKLIEAWDTPSILENLSKNNSQSAKNPYLSIIAATQPRRLAGTITDEDIHSGFANRWLFIPGSGQGRIADPPDLDRRAAHAVINAINDNIRSYRSDGTELRLSPIALRRWNDWYEKQGETAGRDEDEDAMQIRHANLIRKLALIYAVCDGADEVTDSNLESAMALVDWMWGHLCKMIKTWGADPSLVIEERIISVLKKFGAQKRRDLLNRSKRQKIKTAVWNETFKAMRESGTLYVDPSGLIYLAETVEGL